MATVYKIKLTSHWINYTEMELANKIKDLLEADEKKNEYSIEVERELSSNMNGVNQQSELLTGFVRFERLQGYKYKLLSLNKKIEKYLTSL